MFVNLVACSRRQVGADGNKKGNSCKKKKPRWQIRIEKSINKCTGYSCGEVQCWIMDWSDREGKKEIDDVWGIPQEGEVVYEQEGWREGIDQCI